MATDTTEPTLVPIARPNTPEWLAMRNSGIGSSDASAAVGLSTYSTPLEVYSRKIGEIEEFQGNEVTDFGTFMEPGILQLWEKKTGDKVINYPCPMYRSPTHPHMIATPDAQLSATEGVEIKSLTWRWIDRLPGPDGMELTDDTPEYIIQAQHQMFVTGWKQIHFAVLVERVVHCYYVPRNDRLIEGIVEAEQELWDRIVNRDPPEPDWEHSRINELMCDIYYQVADGYRIELSDACVESWERQKQAAREIKQLEKLRETERAKVMFEIGEHYAGVLPCGEKMVRRKLIEKQPYAVEPKPYIDMREVKYDGGIMHIPIDAEELSARYEKADNILRAAGFGRHDKSEWGSTYYIHHELPIRVRVSDHSPNRATRTWMENVDCVDLRIDRPDIKLKEEIDNLLKQEKDNGDSNDIGTEKADHATDKATKAV